jgi:hypothetical protein
MKEMLNMADWQTPKTNWTPTDGLLDTDMNRIEGNEQYLKDNVYSKSESDDKYVQGNTKAWVATAVTMDDTNHAYVLTVPNFTFSEGCQVTFKVPTLPIEDQWMHVDVGDKKYALRTTTQEMVTNDAWKVNSFITVTLTQAVVIDLGTSRAGRDGTAFFKGGTAADTASINSALTLSTVAPTATLKAGKLWGVY